MLTQENLGLALIGISLVLIARLVREWRGK
jgi:hypothetical protein